MGPGDARYLETEARMVVYALTYPLGLDCRMD